MFTLIDNGRALETQARIAGDAVRLAPDEVRAALGWELTEEGLCGHGVCIPVPDGAGLASADGIDLAALARLLARPLAVDLAEGAAFVGAAARDRAQALRSLEAPDFTLPDLDGRLHSLHEHRGQKVLLVVYASW